MKAKVEIPISQKKEDLMHETNLELEQKIRQRAYELYEGRGCEEGHELEDWLKAESEVQRKPIAA